MDGIDVLFHALFRPEIQSAAFPGTWKPSLFMLILDVIEKATVALENLVTNLACVPDLLMNGVDVTK